MQLVNGNADVSVHDLTEAIKLNPNSASAYNNRGLDFGGKKGPRAARRDYDDAIAINPVYALAYANRGYLKEARHQKNAAIDDLRPALQLDPSLVNARNVLRRLGGSRSIASESERRVRDGKALVERDVAVAMPSALKAEIRGADAS